MTRTRRIAIVMALLLIAAGGSTAYACEGPGATARMLRADVVGWSLGAVAALIFASCWVLWRRSARKHTLTAMAVLAAIHPGWWLSSQGGDCGVDRTLFSALTTLAVFGLACRLALSTRRNPKLTWFR